MPTCAVCATPAELEHSSAEHLRKACLLHGLFFGPMYAALAAATSHQGQRQGGEGQDLQKDASLTTLFSVVDGSQTSPTSG